MVGDSERSLRLPFEVWPRVQQWEGWTKFAVSSLFDSIGSRNVAAKTEVEATLERAREEKKAAQSNQQAQETCRVTRSSSCRTL